MLIEGEVLLPRPSQHEVEELLALAARIERRGISNRTIHLSKNDGANCADALRLKAAFVEDLHRRS